MQANGANIDNTSRVRCFICLLSSSRRFLFLTAVSNMTVLLLLYYIYVTLVLASSSVGRTRDC